MKKIKIANSWASSQEITNRILQQFKTPNLNLSDIEFVHDNSYDIIVYFNHITEEPLFDKKGYIFPNEPYWAGSHQKDISQYSNVTMFGFDCTKYIGDCIESKMHMVYGGQGPPYDKLDFWNYDNLNNLKIDKTHNISSTITQKKDELASTCLYKKRYNLIEYIKDLEFLDLYGGWNKFTDKKDTLLKYRFCLSIENEYSNNLITEKFYDCILTDTIPIYYGCKNIKSLYPENGYLLIEDINDLEGIRNLLININTNAIKIYSDMISETKKIKQKLFNEHNVLKTIIELPL